MTPPLIRKSVAELAAFLGGQAEGDLACLIEGVAALDAAGPSDLSFLENPKYAEAAKASKAGCLLLPPQAKGQVFAAKARIYIEDAREAFSRILILIEAGRPKLAPVLSPKASIHYEARLGPGVSVGDFTVIERGAAVAEGTVIGPQCFIGENARVGRACRLSPGVVIRENCVVGDRAVLHAGAVIGADGFGFTTDRKTGRHGKMPQIGNVVLENDVEVGANTTIDRATIGSTVIGAGTKIDNLVQIGHNVRTGRDCLLVSQVGISGSTILGDRVILAGQAGLAGHLRIGDGAIVMAQSGIMGDVEAGAAVFGSPARPRREAFKLLALTAKLSEIYESIKEIKEKLGLKPRDRAAAQD